MDTKDIIVELAVLEKPREHLPIPQIAKRLCGPLQVAELFEVCLGLGFTPVPVG
jgi:hypothetical protein